MIAVAAIKVRGRRILTSDAFRVVIRADKPPTAESIKVHHLRAQEVALEGRCIKFCQNCYTSSEDVRSWLLRRLRDVTMLDKYVLPYIQAKLPNPRIDVSAIYYALKYRNAPPGTVHDLRFASMLSDLGLPALHQHDAFNDALMTAMMYVQLRDMQERGVQISRLRNVQQHVPVCA